MASAAQAALLQSLGIKNNPDAGTPSGISDTLRPLVAPGFLNGISQPDPPQMQQAQQQPMLAPRGTPQNSVGGGGVNLLVDAAKRAGFTGGGLLDAVAIGLAESQGNPNATNTAGNSAGTDRGLWQINDYYHRDLFNNGLNWADPYANAQAAYQISNGGSNWGPWSTYNSGAFRSYIRQASQALGMGG